MKTSLLVFAWVALLWIARPVWALSTFTQLTPANLDRQHIAFTIKAEREGTLVRFEVSARRKTGEWSPQLEGRLAVWEGNMQVAECPIEKTMRDGQTVYSFSVAAKYLEKSKFTFAEYAHSNGQPMPAMDCFWFILKDFNKPG